METRPLNELPWYAFLYRLLGAQGTFWLWLLTGLALWWTTEPALIRLVNRTPRSVALSSARQPGATLRWVKVEGVELRLDRALLLRAEAPTLPPALLLLEPNDPSARFWAETRAWVDLAEGSPSLAAIGGFMNAIGEPADRLLGRRYAELQQNPEVALPAPGRATLILPPTPGQLTAPDAPRADNDLAAFRAIQSERNARVRAAVHAGSTRGVLDPTPETFLTRLEGELGVRPAGYLVQAEVRPSELETRVFGAAALLLVFLSAGLWGAARTGLSPSEKRAAEAGPPPTAPEPGAAPAPEAA